MNLISVSHLTAGRVARSAQGKNRTSPSLSSTPFPFLPAPPPLHSLPLEAGPLNPARGAL